MKRNDECNQRPWCDCILKCKQETKSPENTTFFRVALWILAIIGVYVIFGD